MRIDRREFLKSTGKLVLLTSAAALSWDSLIAGRPEAAPNYKLQDHWWGFAIDIEKCIGCGNCVRACKTETTCPWSHTTSGPGWSATTCPEGISSTQRWTRPMAATTGSHPGTSRGRRQELLRAQALQPLRPFPCVQVCPVGATF